MKYEPPEIEVIVRRVHRVKSCSQCGKRFSARACGPTHAILAAYPQQRRIIGDAPLWNAGAEV